MSYTREVQCDRCEGTGIEPTFPDIDGRLEWQPDTVCTSCSGQGHIRRDPDPQPARLGRAEL